MMKALPTNILVNHPSYSKILFEYNERLRRDGKVNNKKFYEEVVSPNIPGYAMQTWYSFLKRFKTTHGLIAAEVANVEPSAVKEEQEKSLATTMLTNQQATQALIQGALNISAAAAKQLMEDPTLLTPEKRLELGLKAMKAQDSRIHAVGKLREDNREQERFDRAFSGAQYAE